jgi:hypothetical protein
MPSIIIPTNVLAPVDLMEAAEKLGEQARALDRVFAQSDYDGTEDARAEIAEARKYLGWVAGAFERAQKLTESLEFEVDRG